MHKNVILWGNCVPSENKKFTYTSTADTSGGRTWSYSITYSRESNTLFSPSNREDKIKHEVFPASSLNCEKSWTDKIDYNVNLIFFCIFFKLLESAHVRFFQETNASSDQITVMNTWDKINTLIKMKIQPTEMESILSILIDLQGKEITLVSWTLRFMLLLFKTHNDHPQ